MGQFTLPEGLDPYRVIGKTVAPTTVIAFERTDNVITYEGSTTAQLEAAVAECQTEDITPPSMTAPQSEEDLMAFTFFCDVLVRLDIPMEVVGQGLQRRVFHGLPTFIPENREVFNWAIYNDGLSEGYKLLWWNDRDEEWILSSYPWTAPYAVPAHIIDQDNAIGSGDNTWAFWMGTEVRVRANCTVRQITAKMQQAGARNWQIIRSSETGSAAPALSTYTEILASGQQDWGANAWTREADDLDVDLNEDDWVIFWSYVGVGGQRATITTERLDGNLTEDLVAINAGAYKFVGGSIPGTTTPGTPTTRSTSTLFGIVSAFLEAR